VITVQQSFKLKIIIINNNNNNNVLILCTIFNKTFNLIMMKTTGPPEI